MLGQPLMMDPFDDPFFRDPFSMMGNTMQHMNNMMNGMFNDPFFSGRQRPAAQVGP